MLISIIIPAYNVEDYIEECVVSAFAQDYSPLEVICIDNNSTDRTWFKLEQLKQQYPELIIDKEQKAGAPAARNKGLRLSKGEWLQFLDADDLLMPDKIKHQVALLQNTSYDFPFIAATYIKRDLEGKEEKIIVSKDKPFKSLFVTQLGITSANLWNRQYIEKVNGWNESLKSSQEADLMFRLLQIKDEVLYDDEAKTIVRVRSEGQISQRGELARLTQYLDLRWGFYNWLLDNQKQYVEENIDFFLSKIFQLLQKISLYDLDSGESFYLKYLKGKPIKNLNFAYRLALKIFGFRKAEQIRQYILKL